MQVGVCRVRGIGVLCRLRRIGQGLGTLGNSVREFGRGDECFWGEERIWFRHWRGLDIKDWARLGMADDRKRGDREPGIWLTG